MADISASIDEFDAALVHGHDAESRWDALRGLTGETIGARLFTIMEIDSVRRSLAANTRATR